MNTESRFSGDAGILPAASGMLPDGSEFKVAHASRVLVSASRRNKLLLTIFNPRKVRNGETPLPTRETRALPGALTRVIFS
jgi:hypothetical protein